MTDNPQTDLRLRAVLTVTVETRPDGGHYFDQADFTAHATEWVRAALKGQHAVDEVTVVDQAAELARAQAEAHQYRTALQGAARAAAVPSAPADRAAILREAADICDEAGAVYTSKAFNDHADGAFALMERFLRKADEAEYVATSCSLPNVCEDGGEPCSTHERLMAHAEGDHELCGPDCGISPSRTAGDGLAAATCSAQYHGHGETRLCIRAAQHTGKAHTDEHGFHWSDTVAVYPLAAGQFRTGINVRAELRRMADEAQQPETQAAGWHLTPETLDLFVRALVNEVDYDIHKGYERGEEDGADHYPELVADAAEMLDAITAVQPAAVSQPGKEA